MINKKFLRFSIFFLVVVTFFAKYSIPKQGEISYIISQEYAGGWKEKYTHKFGVQYSTKDFYFLPKAGKLKLNIVQKNISYGDIELLQVQACGKSYTPKSAYYEVTGESVLSDVAVDDHNVAVNHEQPIIAEWELPKWCLFPVMLTMKANEYYSPEALAFRFPLIENDISTYKFKNNGSLNMDGKLQEVDGIEQPTHSPFWKATSGHPSNNTLIYLRDDKEFVYIAIDILLDNTNEFGQDWFKVNVFNMKDKVPKTYRVDDFDNTYGKCSFGQTSKVSYRHQTCEMKIPKADMLGGIMDFTIRYYGTGVSGVLLPAGAIEQFSVCPAGLTVYNNNVVFSAADVVNGQEPWISDGSSASLINDIIPGVGGSNPSNWSVFNGEVYFSANDGVTGDELWKTDGTLAGTSLIADLNPGGAASNPQTYLVYNGELYFSVDDGVSGRELWKTDGTLLGTVMVADINPGASSSDPTLPVLFNGELYFRANDGINGEELWKTDGTLLGTVMVADINPGASSGSPDYITLYNGEIYFLADDGVNGYELWKSDGTLLGTALVADINPGAGNSVPDIRVVYNGELYFIADDGVNGNELWKTDGTLIGTVMVADINPGPGSANLSNFVLFNSELFFAADDGVNGTELWHTDGTGGGTGLVLDISAFPLSSNPQELIVFNGSLYFIATDPILGRELFISDGTAVGTSVIYDASVGGPSSNPAELTILNNQLLFSATPNLSPCGLFAITFDAATATASTGGDDDEDSQTCEDKEPQDGVGIVDVVRIGEDAVVSFTPSGGDVDYYEIAFGLTDDANSGSVTVDTQQIIGIINFTITNLDPNAVYYFRVRAINGCASGEWSDIFLSAKVLGIKFPRTGKGRLD